MSTSAFTIIYGVPFNKSLRDRLELWREDEDSEHFVAGGTLNDLGFIELYSDKKEDVGYCGIELSVFDELADPGMKLTRLNLTPTEDEKMLAQAKINSLPDHIKEHITEPEIWFVPHTF